MWVRSVVRGHKSNNLTNNSHWPKTWCPALTIQVGCQDGVLGKLISGRKLDCESLLGFHFLTWGPFLAVLLCAYVMKLIERQHKLGPGERLCWLRLCGQGIGYPLRDCSFFTECGWVTWSVCVLYIPAVSLFCFCFSTLVVKQKLPGVYVQPSYRSALSKKHSLFL